MTYARIDAQNIHIPMPRCKVDETIDEGDVLTIGDKTLEVWSTPGHTAGQLSFRMGDLLFSGDNIFRDGCVGVIDAHHGSNLVDYIASLKRIRDCDAEYLLPSHGPIFRKDDALLDATIAPARIVHPHGRLRHLRHRLAAAGPVGRRAGPGQAQLLSPRGGLVLGDVDGDVRPNFGPGVFAPCHWTSSSSTVRSVATARGSGRPGSSSISAGGAAIA